MDEEGVVLVKLMVVVVVMEDVALMEERLGKEGEQSELKRRRRWSPGTCPKRKPCEK